jgi:hypothetical protein
MIVNINVNTAMYMALESYFIAVFFNESLPSRTLRTVALFPNFFSHFNDQRTLGFYHAVRTFLGWRM